MVQLNTGISEENIKRKKTIIFLCAIVLSFFTSMSKIIVPGSVFSALQTDPGLKAGMITAMGAVYMYAYAASQLALGVLSAKIGGVRILLTGGTLFALGSLLFPLLSRAELMLLARLITGFGAGTVFVGLAKLISDLFPKKFALVLGTALFISYLGPVAGGYPVVSCISRFSWRPVLLVCGLIPAVLVAVVWIFSPGTLKKILPGSSVSQLRIIFSSRNGFRLFFCSSVAFGVYYAIMTTMGQKSLIDFGQFSPAYASAVISSLGIIVALLNLLTASVLKLFRNNGILLSVIASVFVLAAAVLGTAVFYFRLSGFLLALAFVLSAIPAGFFSIYGTVVKDFYPDELSGLAIAILNCAAFVAIAASGNIAGFILSIFEKNGGTTAWNGVYPPEAYAVMFGVFAVFAAAGLFAACRIQQKDN